jgi:hypothetical protein
MQLEISFKGFSSKYKAIASEKHLKSGSGKLSASFFD